MGGGCGEGVEGMPEEGGGVGSVAVYGEVCKLKCSVVSCGDVWSGTADGCRWRLDYVYLPDLWDKC
jgi:hypothetical protein